MEARFRGWWILILLTWILVLRARCRYLCWLKLQSRGATISLCYHLLWIRVTNTSSKVCMRTSSKTIHNSVELSVSLGSCRSSHTLLFLSLWWTVVFVIRCVRLCLLHRATESTLVIGTTREGTFLLVSTELVIGTRDALVIPSPFLIRKLHVLILHVRPINLNLLKFP